MHLNQCYLWCSTASSPLILSVLKHKQLESRKDELEIAIKDLDEIYEQEMDSHQDIRVYVEEKVIKKADEVDFMIDREEVSFYL